VSRLVLLLALGSACGPNLTADSPPPAGRSASLVGHWRHYDLVLSQGVAIAVTCDVGHPCQDVVVSTNHPAIADVKGAAFGTLERHPYAPTAATPAGLVIVGKAPGKAKIKVKTAHGTKTIYVKIVPPPAVGMPATRVARP
jgi:hypothetical protein